MKNRTYQLPQSEILNNQRMDTSLNKLDSMVDWKSNIWILFISFLCVATCTMSCQKDDSIIPDIFQNEKQIVSFVFLLTENPINQNIIGLIDEQSKSITAEMPIGTNLNGLIPSIEVSQNATISPQGAQNFNNPVNYVVTAEDGTSVSYTINVSAEPSQRQILQAILDVNPENTLGWDITNTANLNDLRGVRTNFEGKINNLDLEGKRISNLPPEIGNLTNLQTMDLEENRIQTIPFEIGHLSNLEELDLSYNKLRSVPKEIANLRKLKNLDLSDNNIQSIPLEIGRMLNLNSLNLSYNKLNSIPKQLGNLTNLSYLGLANNNLQNIPAEIGFLSKLENLSIFNNNLEYIPTAILYLSYSGNQLHQDVGTPIRTTPNSVEALISLYASNPGNRLQWSVDNFPEVEFTENNNPKVITANNKGIKTIPPDISSLISLEALNLNNNNLGEIPESIGEMTNLASLTLHNTNIKTVPSSLGNLDNLSLLSITKNPITSIPVSVCDRQTINGGILTILTDPGEGCD